MEYCVKVRFVDGTTQTHRCKARGHGEAIHKIQRALSSSGLSDLVDFIHKPREVTKEGLAKEFEDLVRYELQEQFGAGDIPSGKELQRQIKKELGIVHTLLGKAEDKLDELSMFEEYASGMSTQQLQNLQKKFGQLQKALNRIKQKQGQ